MDNNKPFHANIEPEFRVDLGQIVMRHEPAYSHGFFNAFANKNHAFIEASHVNTGNSFYCSQNFIGERREDCLRGKPYSLHNRGCY